MPKMLRPGLCAALLLTMVPLPGCGPKAGPVPAEDRHRTGRVADEDDRCHVVACPDVDHDGCPDVFLRFAEGSAELDDPGRKLVAEMHGDMDAIGARLRTLRVHGTWVDLEDDTLGMARAAAVKTALMAAGADGDHIHIAEEAAETTVGPGVWFEVTCE